MSQYSGKCDVYDSLIAINRYTNEELKNNVDIYIGNVKTPLKIESQKDLIPYYAHLISCSFHNNEKRKASVYITSESFVDREEREILEFYLEQLLKIYNRCKRKKVEYNVLDAVKEVCWSNWNKEQIMELADRVKEYGNKATVVDIHLAMHEHYRKELADEMLKNGLNPAHYGYGRFMNKND